MVIAQNFTSTPGGTVAMPLGTGAIAVPIYRRANYVQVDTGKYQYQWVESVGRAGSLVLAVGGEVKFYREDEWFIVMDRKNKKHKFSIVALRVQPQPVPAAPGVEQSTPADAGGARRAPQPAGETRL